MSVWRRLGFGEAQAPLSPDDDASGAVPVLAVTVAEFGIVDRLRLLASGRAMFVASVYLQVGEDGHLQVRNTYPAVSVLPPNHGRPLPSRMAEARGR